MAEDRTIDLARVAAAKFVRDADVSERPAIFAAASVIVGNARSEQRFGAAFCVGIVQEIQHGGSPKAAADALFASPTQPKGNDHE